MKDRAKFDIARNKLLESGLGLTTHDWTTYCDATLGKMYSLANSLKSAIMAIEAFAYYNDSEIEITDYRAARAAIVDCIVDITVPENPSRRPAFAAIAAVNAECVTIAESLNALKAQWRDSHSAIRAYAGFNEAGIFNATRATEAIRRVLQLAGYNAISLARSDRKIPVLLGEVLKVRWFRADATPTARKTVGDFIEALRLVRNDYELRDELIDLINAEILKFSRMGQELSVSQRLREANPSYRFRAMVLDGGTRTSFSDYAASPILFEQSVGSILPQIHVYDEVAESENGKGRGAPRKIGERLVHEDLASFGELRSYFYYLEKPENQKVSGKPARNPFTKTTIPLITLQPRKRKNRYAPYLVVQLARGKQSVFNIEKLGIDVAWRLGVEAYTAHVKSGYESLAEFPPLIQQVADMIEWANTKSKPDLGSCV